MPVLLSVDQGLPPGAGLAVGRSRAPTDRAAECKALAKYSLSCSIALQVLLHEINEHPAELAAYFAEHPHERTLAYSYAIKEAIPKVDRANKLAAALIVALVKEPIDFLASSSSISNHMAISLTTSWR